MALDHDGYEQGDGLTLPEWLQAEVDAVEDERRHLRFARGLLFACAFMVAFCGTIYAAATVYQRCVVEAGE